jgi:heterodisulfide reductase subunit C
VSITVYHRSGPAPSVTDFAEAIRDATGEDVRRCYQCAKCTAGCPNAFAQLGLKDIVLRASAIWLCVGCETCTARCPRDIDVARVMKGFCEMAVREGVRPAEPRVRTFHEEFLRSVQAHGRCHELGMMAALKLKTRDPFTDMGLGMSLFSKGKLSLLPHRVRDLPAVRKLFRSREKGA